MGVDGILAILETYFPIPEAGIVSYFTEIAQAVSCPVVLYTNPNFQKGDLTLGAIEQLAAISNIGYAEFALCHRNMSCGRWAGVRNGMY